MTDTKQSQRRGRPRAFNPDVAVAKALPLFRAHGYDGVGIAMLTQALGINPPSFYAAFGSKAEFFGRVLDRHADGFLPVDAILVPESPPARAIGELLETAARAYTADPEAAGCLVMESARAGGEPDSRAKARALKDAVRERIRTFLATSRPGWADPVADFTVTIMSGMSAGAREGWPQRRLTEIAHMSERTVAGMLREKAPAGRAM